MPSLPILFDSPDFIAINKPAHLAAIPGRGETTCAIAQLAGQIDLPCSGSTDPRLRVVHRLDKDTTGVLLFAKHIEAQRHLSHQFQNNRVTKTYLAIVRGSPSGDEGTIDAPIGPHPTDRRRMAVTKHGRSAVTVWQVEARYRGFALLRCFPRTGKTHQIRVHLAHLGLPLAFDELYNPSREPRVEARPPGLYLSDFKRGYQRKRDEVERPLIARLTLHAEKLQFDDLAARRVQIAAEVPRDIRATINMLQKYAR